MAKHADTLLRQWHLLRKIPRHPQKITSQTLYNYLLHQNYEVTERTVQRDLTELSRVFEIVADERNKPYGWSWAEHAESFDLPGMSSDEALTWVLAEQHVRQMLPSSTLDYLRPYFKTAHKRLNGETQPNLGHSWLNKVRTVPPTQPLIPTTIDPEVQRLISEALLREYQVELRYRRKGERECKTYQAHPLALIQRGGVLYLFTRLFDYPNAMLLALHRIEQVTPLVDRPAEAPPGFDLDEELAKGRLDFGSGERIEIQLKFYAGKGEHLYETPLSEDQRIEETPDQKGELTVTAAVADTPQLKWWILGFGDGVEVLTPETLRLDLSQTSAKMAAIYAIDPAR